MERVNLCMHCGVRIEYDEYEEAWFHIIIRRSGREYNDCMTCDPMEPRDGTVAFPLLVIEEIPG